MSGFNLFIYKKESIYFRNFICIQFSKILFTLIVSKKFITKFQFGHKNYFYLLLLENNDFLQFYLHNISICFHLRKMTYTNY